MHNQETSPSTIEAPYGTWDSPITALMTTRGEKTNRNCDIIVNDEGIFWTEPRPNEKGRSVVVHLTQDHLIKTLTPPGFDVRSKVNEYGGLAFAVVGKKIYFVNAKDQRIYVQEIDSEPKPLTEEGTLFADLLPTSQGLIAIGETHGDKQTDNFLAFIDTQTGTYIRLDQGQDFYASPALSGDGKKLAWLTWNHPNMPWDGCFLWTADFDRGSVKNKMKAAGGLNESIYQPQWSPQGTLYYVSDRSGWWNLHRLKDQQAENVAPLQAEFGLPLWRLGTSTWRFTGREEEILCAYREKGVGKIALLDPDHKQLKPFGFDYTDYGQITMGPGFALFLAGSARASRRIIKLDLNSFTISPIDAPDPLDVDPENFSIPNPIEFPSENGRSVYGYFYPPKNKKYRGVAGSLPPLMIISHGGPTSAADLIFNLRIQYWTSRGFALLDVNYGGSTGYGREYREQLKGQWGVMDVEDCISGGTYLAKIGKVNAGQIVIRGGSAGGFTTLTALTRTKIFAAGASYCGVSDLELLVQDTHKFESNYLDTLIGPYPARKDLYVERSPIHNADKISSPVIFFQGEKDKVVPPNQAYVLYEALQKRGVESKLVLYKNEEHGLRQSENIQDSLEQELQFYLKAFGTG